MIGVLVSGEGSNLQALIDAGLPLSCVVSNRPGIRALARARVAGIDAAVFELSDYPDRERRDTAMADWLVERGVELVVLAGYMHLLSEPFLSRFPDRIVNVHPSLLPEFPGAHAIDDALAASVETTGVTVHLVDAGLDTGPVLAQEPVPVEPSETLVERIHAVEHRLLPEVVRDLCGADLTMRSEPSGRAGRHARASSVAPIVSAIEAPCVLRAHSPITPRRRATS
ncbi:MAG TPA: phosphoribosylglycinamide formyltransferase [Gaiellaceae bacterium]